MHPLLPKKLAWVRKELGWESFWVERKRVCVALLVGVVVGSSTVVGAMGVPSMWRNTTQCVQLQPWRDGIEHQEPNLMGPDFLETEMGIIIEARSVPTISGEMRRITNAILAMDVALLEQLHQTGTTHKRERDLLSASRKELQHLCRV